MDALARALGIFVGAAVSEIDWAKVTPLFIAAFREATTPTVEDAKNVPQQVADDLQKRIADSQH